MNENDWAEKLAVEEVDEVVEMKYKKEEGKEEYWRGQWVSNTNDHEVINSKT